MATQLSASVFALEIKKNWLKFKQNMARICIMDPNLAKSK